MPYPVFRSRFVVGADAIDQVGHVNNRVYLRWMEAIATEHAASVGWDYEHLTAARRMWVVREHWIEYLRPAFEGDEVEVLTWVQSAHGATSLRRYAVKRGRELLAAGATEWCFVDTDRGRPVIIPPEAIECFSFLPETDPLLVELGVNRPMRWKPRDNLL